MRKCMYPNTAMNLQDSSTLKLASYVRAAKYYKVSHLISFNNKNNSSDPLIQKALLDLLKWEEQQ